MLTKCVHARESKSQSLSSNYKNHLHLGFPVYAQRALAFRGERTPAGETGLCPEEGDGADFWRQSSEEDTRVHFVSGREGTWEVRTRTGGKWNERPQARGAHQRCTHSPRRSQPRTPSTPHLGFRREWCHWFGQAQPIRNVCEQGPQPNT